uniref:fibronectin type III domain-containing protein n=1 Tax=Lachnospira sp. TaxID=2049031 RepID=UPI003FEF643B
MKRQTKRRIMALVMAALMVVGLIPTGFAAKAVSAANNVYTFDASAETAITTAEKKADIAAGKYGTEGYFTLSGKVTRGNSSTFSAELAKGADDKEEGALTFTVTGTADVVVTATSTGSTNTSDLALVDASGNKIDGIKAVTGTKPETEIKYTNLAAGTYSIIAPKDGENNRGVRVLSAVVTEIAAAVVTSDYTFDASAETAITTAEKKADIAAGKYGTEGYFTLSGKVTRGNSSTFSAELAKGADDKEEGALTFTVTGTADVVVTATSTGSTNTSDLALVDASGNKIDGIKAVTGTKPETEIKYTNLVAGTYSIIAPKDGENNRGVRILKTVVTQTSGGERPARADWSGVAAPVLGDVTSKDGKITVPFTMVIGYDGADKVVVTMTDEAGKEVASESYAKDTTGASVTFTPSASGKYTFSIKAVRDGGADKTGAETKTADFVLPLATSAIGSIYNKGNGSVAVEWSAVKEATSYVVEYSNDGKNWASLDAADKTEATIKGLTVGSEYSVRVVAKRGEDTTTSKEATIKVTKEAQQKWGQITYGNGASSSKDSFTGSVNEGKVTIKSASGKLVPASFDGVSFYYTEVPASQNFTLRAKVTVDSWTLSNGQEGFGLMAADKLGGSGWNNSYMAVASKTEYYWNEETKEVTTDSSTTKVSQKIGLASQEKTGVTKDNIAAIEANDTATVQANFKSTSYPLEQRYPEAKNIIGNSTNTPADAGDITEMYLTIQKNNTGYFVTYESADGSYSTTKKYYDTEALERIDSDYVYAGFFASRNATATFSDITFTTIDPKEDAPAEERPIEKVSVNTYVQSATATGSADYEFLFSANCDGTLSIEDAKGEVVVSDVEVKADTLVKPASVTLNKGKNEYKINFTPAEGYKPNGEYSAMESYETVVIDHTVTYKTFGEAGQSIWVAPDAKGSGSKEDPMSIYDAVKYVMPSQQIVLTEGTYKLESPLKIARGINGTADQMIYMLADPDAKTRPVIDFQGLCTGMTIGGDYWYFKGFDVTGSADGQKGLQVSGSHNTLDQIETYHNGNTGLQISRLNVTDTYAEWPSYNLILNCTSYGNADKGYEDADGFAAKLTVGDGNVFDGCIAHHNADDGWDLFAKVQTGSIGSVTIKNSIAYANGYLEDGTNAGNGNGFKMGGDSMPGSHVLENSIAFANKAKGIDSNSCPDIKVKNCTSINNQGANVAFYTNSAKNTDFEATGVISFRTAKEDVAENIKPVGSQDLTKIYKATNFYWDTASKTSFNTPEAGEAVTTVSADWFASLDYSSILDGNKSVAGIVRNADGTIALGNIFKLTDKAPAGVGADFSIEKLTKSSNPTIGTPVPTGDKANTALYVVLIVLSVLALGGVCFYEVKRKKNRVK